MQKARVLERLIRERGYNLKAFAEKCDIPYTTLYGIIKNGVDRASVQNIMNICRHLGITIEELEQMAQGITLEQQELSYEDVEQVIARNGKHMSTEQKMRLIQLLSEIQ